MPPSGIEPATTVFTVLLRHVCLTVVLISILSISEQCTEGIVAISSNTLRILALEKLGAVFNQTYQQLEYTPRKFVVNADNNQIIILETDHNSYTEEMKKQRR